MQVRRALLVTMADRYVAMAVNFLSLAIVARLMAPADFGIAVLGTAITSMAVAAREFASQTWLIPRRELTTDATRCFFTLMVLVTLLVVAAIGLAAGRIEEVYGHPGIAFYLYLICLALLVEPIHQTIGGLLRREMMFGQVALLNVTNSVVQAAVLTGLVATGLSFESFGWSWLASASATSAVALIVRRDFRIFRPRLSGLLEQASFGAYNGVAALLYRAFEALPLLAVGHIVGVTATGVFYRVLALVQLPDRVLLSGVASVALPAFAREARAGGSLRDAYLRSVEYISVFQWPALGLLAILAEPTVLTLFGGQWAGIAPLVPVAAAAWMFTFTSEINYPVLVASGAIRANLVRSALIYPASGLIIIVAAGWGLEAAVWSLLAVCPLQAVVSVMFVRHVAAIPLRDLLLRCPRSIVVTLAACAGPFLLVQGGFAGIATPVLQLLIAAPLAAFGWTVAVILTRHPLRSEVTTVLQTRLARLARYRPAAPAKRSMRPTSAAYAASSEK
jgi:O-antigen/teichoic acid export membrane protein